MQEENKYISDEKRHLEQRLLDDPLRYNDHRRQIENLKEQLYNAETCMLCIYYNIHFSNYL